MTVKICMLSLNETTNITSKHLLIITNCFTEWFHGLNITLHFKYVLYKRYYKSAFQMCEKDVRMRHTIQITKNSIRMRKHIALSKKLKTQHKKKEVNML